MTALMWAGLALGLLAAFIVASIALTAVLATGRLTAPEMPPEEPAQADAEPAGKSWEIRDAPRYTGFDALYGGSSD